MIFRATSLLIILFLCVEGRGLAQTAAEIEAMKELFVVPAVRAPRYAQARDNKNEMELVFSGLFLGYKNFFSSQDSRTCTFHPSCSEYGMEAVKTYGIWKGMFVTFDRLTRCNGLSPQKYTINPKTGTLSDPVREPTPPIQ